MYSTDWSDSKLESEYQEIPTIPSTMDQIAKTIEDLPLEEIVNNLNHTIEGLDKLVNSPEVKETVVSLNKALKEITLLVRNANGELKPLTASIRDTFAVTRATLESSRETIDKVREELSDNAPVISYELSQALRELTTAARSLKALTDYLQQHPESLLRGKGGK